MGLGVTVGVGVTVAVGGWVVGCGCGCSQPVEWDGCSLLLEGGGIVVRLSSLRCVRRYSDKGVHCHSSMLQPDRRLWGEGCQDWWQPQQPNGLLGC
jgi:hypothetical protein